MNLKKISILSTSLLSLAVIGTLSTASAMHKREKGDDEKRHSSSRKHTSRPAEGSKSQGSRSGLISAFHALKESEKSAGLVDELRRKVADANPSVKGTLRTIKESDNFGLYRDAVVQAYGALDKDVARGIAERLFEKHPNSLKQGKVASASAAAASGSAPWRVDAPVTTTTRPAANPVTVPAGVRRASTPPAQRPVVSTPQPRRAGSPLLQRPTTALPAHVSSTPAPLSAARPDPVFDAMDRARAALLESQRLEREMLAAKFKRENLERQRKFEESQLKLMQQTTAPRPPVTAPVVSLGASTSAARPALSPAYNATGASSSAVRPVDPLPTTVAATSSTGYKRTNSMRVIEGLNLQPNSDAVLRAAASPGLLKEIAPASPHSARALLALAETYGYRPTADDRTFMRDERASLSQELAEDIQDRIGYFLLNQPTWHTRNNFRSAKDEALRVPAFLDQASKTFGSLKTPSRTWLRTYIALSQALEVVGQGDMPDYYVLKEDVVAYPGYGAVPRGMQAVVSQLNSIFRELSLGDKKKFAEAYLDSVEAVYFPQEWVDEARAARVLEVVELDDAGQPVVEPAAPRALLDRTAVEAAQREAERRGAQVVALPRR